jgi:hypothetical protein
MTAKNIKIKRVPFGTLFILINIRNHQVSILCTVRFASTKKPGGHPGFNGILNNVISLLAF